MKKGLLSTLFFLFTILCGTSSYSQALGDIAFTGYNSTDPDNFSFVVLRTGGLTPGMSIGFTDIGWNGQPGAACGTNSWGSPTVSETEILFTTNKTIPYGEQVVIQGLTATHNGSSANLTVTGTALNFGGAGDQVFAFVGARTAGNIIAGIHMNFIPPSTTTAANWDNSAAVGGTDSNRPACIVNGTHGLFITQPSPPSPSPEVDNARIKASVILTGDPATDRSRVNNSANWDVQDGTRFTLPGALSGLPVEFTWIKATERAGRVQVEWGIGLEEEMKDYTVERSGDGRLYTQAGVLAADGRGTYSFIDDKPLGGTNFYRIRATEINGITKYSTVAIVNLSRIGKGITVYPSVIRTKKLSMQINNLPAGSYKLNLHNATGQLVMSKTIVHAGGNSSQTIALPSAISNGVHRLHLTNGKDNAITTIIVQ